MGINKFFNSTMTAPTEYDCEANAYNPDVALVLSGTEEDPTDADVTAWSDGAQLTVWMRFGAQYFTEMATDTELQVAFGREATLTTAPNGAYNIGLVWTYDSSDDTCDVTGQLRGYYLPYAAATTAGDLDNGMTDAVNIYYDSGTSAAPPKYAWTSNKTYTGAADIASADTVNGNFYMPKESDADGETTATGDRLGNGDKILAFGGAGAPEATANG